MTEFRWDPAKNEELKRVRGISFEEILAARFLGKRNHHARANQVLLFFAHRGYVWVVPCVVEGDGVFLKTLFPSRKETKKRRETGRL